jgi:hypothetical protein
MEGYSPLGLPRCAEFPRSLGGPVNHDAHWQHGIAAATPGGTEWLYVDAGNGFRRVTEFLSMLRHDHGKPGGVTGSAVPSGGAGGGHWLLAVRGHHGSFGIMVLILLAFGPYDFCTVLGTTLENGTSLRVGVSKPASRSRQKGGRTRRRSSYRARLTSRPMTLRFVGEWRLTTHARASW